MRTPPLHRTLFFGNDGVDLGVFHESAGDTVRDVGVLLCPPAPQEHSRLRWSVRRLAILLSDAGFPVMRFDLSCTGDSAGDAEDAALTQWVDAC